MGRRKSQRGRQSRSGSAPSGVSLRRTTDGGGWVFVHPRCVRDRAEDIEDVYAMIDAGEDELAIEELRWLLSGCSEFIEAHCLLGELALAVDNDVPLARGHFGFAYQLGLQTLRRANMPSPLPALQPANRPFFLAGRSLVWCLYELNKPEMAQEIVETLTGLDPADPLKLGALVDELRTKGLPMVDLLGQFSAQDDDARQSDK